MNSSSIQFSEASRPSRSSLLPVVVDAASAIEPSSTPKAQPEALSFVQQILNASTPTMQLLLTDRKIGQGSAMLSIDELKQVLKTVRFLTSTEAKKNNLKLCLAVLKTKQAFLEREISRLSIIDFPEQACTKEACEALLQETKALFAALASK